MSCSREMDANGGAPVDEDMTTADLRIVADRHELDVAMANEIAVVLDSAAGRHGAVSIVLAGGRTPRGVYQRLLSGHRHDLPWADMHFFWGDERHVPHDDERSNYHMAREWLLDHVPVRRERVHPMPTDVSPDRAAEMYEQLLRSRFATEWPTFDLVLLGVGEDGHTASLFPGSRALHESGRWVTATTAPVEPHDRVTLTVPAIIHAGSIFVLATGSAKAEAVRRGFAGEPDPWWPVSLMSTTRGRLVWWLDDEAAEKIDTKDR